MSREHSERAAALADGFDAASQEAIEFARGLSDAQWGVVVPGEDWTVGVVLHHIAEGMLNGSGWLASMCQGKPVTSTVETIDEANVDHAARAADIGPDETVALLINNSALVAEQLRGLSDEQLDTVAPFGPAGGRELPAQAMAEASIGHVRGHLAHAKAAAEET
jgi:hypothetical protein